MYRICYVTTVPSTIEAFVKDFAIYMMEQESVEITFISSYDKKFESELPKNIKYIPINMKRGFSFSGIIVTFKLYKFFKKNKFDLVQYSTPNASFYTSISTYLARIKNRLYAQWGILYVGSMGLKRFLLKRIEKITCKLSTSVQPDSFSNLKFSIKENLYNEKKGVVIGKGSAAGVDFNKFSLKDKVNWRNQIRKEFNISDEEFVFGFVGRFVKDKGLLDLLYSFKNIEKQNKSIKLMLVGGERNDLNKINDLIVPWTLTNKNIIFCGTVNETNKYYSAMDTFVLPSYREGFGTVVIESLSMMVPTIVSNIDGPKDIIEHLHNGLVFEKGNIKELTSTMNFMLKNKKETILMAENGYLRAKNNYDREYLFQEILKNRLFILNYSGTTE